MVGVDSSSLEVDSQPRLVGLALFNSYQMNWVNYCNGYAMMTAPATLERYYYYLHQQNRGYVIVLSFEDSANWITDKCRNKRRPNLAGMGKR